MNHKSTAGT